MEQPAGRTPACLFAHLCSCEYFSYVAQAGLELSNGICVMYMECRGQPQGSVLDFHLEMGSLFFLWNTRPDGLSAPGILLSLHPISLEGRYALVRDASVPCLVFMWVLKILIWLLML